VLLQFEDHRLPLESARLDDLVELLVDQFRLTLRNHIHTDFPEQVEESMTSGSKQADELVVAEQQPDFETANQTTGEHETLLHESDRSRALDWAWLDSPATGRECGIMPDSEERIGREPCGHPSRDAHGKKSLDVSRRQSVLPAGNETRRALECALVMGSQEPSPRARSWPGFW
jgi:hypothetical protein